MNKTRWRHFRVADLVAACAAKRKFATRPDADEAQRRPEHKCMKVYKCSVCEGWHLATRRGDR